MKKILIVDDDKDLQQLYGQSLISAGYEVFHAYSGIEGLTLASLHSPDLILLDLMMPGGKNGFDVLERLRIDKKLSRLKVVVLTNLEGEDKIAKSLGVKDYILKTNITALDLPNILKKQFSWLGL
ncbi:hypothetical protein A3B56_03120 [Candidatus Roizmanbacteria bacterium RIFCSPLOWO2_01_FULL_45_11]|uniref:Response regulatory domain-containing protein n=1 Tax=Candidatus Roizmanbacteria bacterium RIFCSPLOWO2_01_FULL_45_11 TaxID=1802070 RepID=A0A1F7JHW6_9BACT|nr:MAG: hypothetical protein A3B56_03120 [Candidatus Roizmanbacteria bacterium RIFCSPLOWO2_01_FULL_45_11]